jgi:ABC-type transporter Mla maintaining outer membrane lipid asymmetry permease subunit MlaE
VTEDRASNSSGDTGLERLSPFSAFQRLITGATNDFSKLVERGPSNFLLAFGATLTVVALFMKVHYGKHHLADLKSSEFISIMVVGLLLLIVGAVLRLEQYRKFNDFEMKKLEQGARLLQPIAEAGKDLVTPSERQEPVV